MLLIVSTTTRNDSLQSHRSRWPTLPSYWRRCRLGRPRWRPTTASGAPPVHGRMPPCNNKANAIIRELKSLNDAESKNEDYARSLCKKNDKKIKIKNSQYISGSLKVTCSGIGVWSMRKLWPPLPIITLATALLEVVWIEILKTEILTSPMMEPVEDSPFRVLILSDPLSLAEVQRQIVRTVDPENVTSDMPGLHWWKELSVEWLDMLFKQ